MSFELERKLIESAYQAGMPSGSSIQFGNAPFVAPSGSYTRLSVMSGGEGRLKEFTGTTSQRFPGVIDVAIFIAPDQGTGPARAIADQVAAALANQTLSEGGTTIRTYGARLDLIGRAGDWYQANVTIRYERDTT